MTTFLSLPLLVFVWASIFIYLLSQNHFQRRICLLFFSATFFLIFSDPVSLAVVFLTGGLTFYLGRNQTLSAWVKMLLIGLPWLLFKLRIFPTHGMPMGLSYLTLAFLSYSRELRAEAQVISGLDFMSAATFYPQLAAGPVVSIVDVTKQIGVKLDRRDFRQGLLLICNGLCKKRIADLVAVYSVGISIESQSSHPVVSTSGTWLSLIALGAEFYGDFSGSTDIAIGIARLIGVELPTNFRLPFLATHPLEFWNSWHISLTQWARKHIFQPAMVIGLNVLGRAHVGISITFATLAAVGFTGFWHGVTLNYLVWAVYNATLILTLPPLVNLALLRAPRARPLMILINFVFVTIGFSFIRLENLRAVGTFLRQLFGSGGWIIPGEEWRIRLVLTILALFAPHAVDFYLIGNSQRLCNSRRWAIFCFLCLIFLTFAPTALRPFIYAQF